MACDELLDRLAFAFLLFMGEAGECLWIGEGFLEETVEAEHLADDLDAVIR
jgi:hypothetical protein